MSNHPNQQTPAPKPFDGFGDMAHAGSYFDKHSSDAEVASSRNLRRSMFRFGHSGRPRR
jgi:hypothetical protein